MFDPTKPVSIELLLRSGHAFIASNMQSTPAKLITINAVDRVFVWKEVLGGWVLIENLYVPQLAKFTATIGQVASQSIDSAPELRRAWVA